MALTITIPGAVEATIGATAPAVLTIGVGTPGATGPAGAAGPGVPVGGTAGQFLTKIDGTNYNTDWTTLPAYLLSSTAASTYQTLAGMSSYLTTATAASTYYLQTNPSGFQTAANVTTALSPYLLSATAASTYAAIAAGQPTAGTVGQVLTKNSGTNYDSSWATLIPGDRYLTSSTTSLTINNANKTLTIGTGLSYSPQQDIVISYDASNHMHARVLTYNSGTGVMDVDVLSHSGAGTYAAWTVNVGGAPALASVVWGDITGTLGNQTDLATALNSKLELAGGVLDANATIEASTTTQASVFSGTGINAALSANPSENVTVNYTGLQVQNAVGTMWVGPAGLTFPNSSVQTVAFPGFNNTALTGDPTAPTPATSDNDTSIATTAFVKAQGYLTSAPVTSVAGKVGVVTLDNTDISGLGTMATATAADYSTTTVANGLYYPLSGNPSSFLVAADIAGKANLASPSFTGNVSISSSTGAALFIEQTGTGNILTLHDQASDTTFVTIDANGKVSTIASEATNGAGFNIAHGVAPTTPVNGDIWTTTTDLAVRLNGTTRLMVNIDGTQTINGSKTFSNANQTLGNSTAASTINVGTGATLTATTKAVNIGTGGVSGSTTNITVGPVLGASTTSIGNTTAASTLNLATGATLTATTKAVNIGTAGVAGSTTNITIGSTTGTSTTTLQGITNGVTQTAGDSSLKLATTAFVTTADNLKANLASPTFSGTPSLPTGTIAVTQTAGNNTTAVATTAFVTAAVPAFASLTEARQFSSTTKAMSPSLALWSMFSADIIYLQRNNFTVTNVGSVQYVNQGAITTETRLAAAASSSSRSRTFGSSQVDQSYSGTVRASVASTLDFSKRTYLAGRSASYDITDPVLTMAFYYGKAEADGVGDLTRRGMGWKVTGGTGSRFLNLQVHNGTTLTSVASSFAVTGNVAFDWDIISDGAGNVTLYVNGSSVATSSAGPTGTVSLTPVLWQEEYSTSASPAISFHTSYHSRGRMAVINY